MTNGCPKPRSRWQRALARAALIAIPLLILMPNTLDWTPSDVLGRIENYLYDLRVRLTIGVGVSTGPMNVGNMGSQFRMAYTVLGGTVNLGSRLEGLTKQYGVDIIVSGATAKAVPDVLFRELDAVRVKGKLEPVAIFEPLGPRSGIEGARVVRTEQFHEFLRLYRCRDFAAALRLLEDLARERHESLIALYHERLTHFLAEPPPLEWDGVFVHKSK